MNSSRAIGVFDSGVGGLSILDKIHQLMPQENLLYVADSAHAPYGQKSDEQLQQRCQAIMTFFLQQKVKAVVLACNTATAASIAMLRKNYTLPIIGMEPALKPAVHQSRAGVVGVLATAGTIDSEKFLGLQNQFSDQVEIITQACPGLVEHIEQQEPDRQKIISLLEKYTAAFKDKGGDTLVLGCTHYSLISGLIAEVVGADVEILDTGFAVAKELQRRLQEAGVEVRVESGSENGDAEVKFYSSGDLVEQGRLISRYWGRGVEVFDF